MKEQIILNITQEMLPYLDNAQLFHLQKVLERTLWHIEITESGNNDDNPVDSNVDLLKSFVNAKRIEGCSEKTLKYYQSTINKMLSCTDKHLTHITTDDLREYLAEYHRTNTCSKSNIDNIRRILSSFFSWLEDEDYILKSPVRRIHKIKSAKTVKETYTDEALERMRDNCGNLRDLAIIDMLASTGMRVGELVGLNRADIDFESRECIVFGKGSK